MKIAIINLTGGGMCGGYRKYLRNVIPLMARHDDVESILCASPESVDVHNWFDPMPDVRFINCKPLRFPFWYHDAELSQELERFSPDVIFVPVERAFCFKKVPVVKMIQNMEPFAPNSDGNPFRERRKLLIQYVDGKRAIKKADMVIAISKFVSDFLVKRLKIPAEKIDLVYHGIDIEKNEFGCKPENIPESWQNNFLFTAGSIRPARGLEDLLLAMKHLSLQEEKSIRLVIAGEAGRRMMGYQKKLRNWIQTNNMSDRICWTGSLNEKEMNWCYQNCRLFVMTSRVEACPNIALEAMSWGCISIAVDNPPLPEIFGDTAVYYSPKDGKALAQAIKTVLAWDDNQRKNMLGKAMRQAERFSWDVCAEKTVEALAKAANR